MEARSYLNQAYVLQRKMENTREELTKVEGLLLQGVSFEEKLGSGDNNKNERVIFRLLELKDKLMFQLDEFISSITEIAETIDKLEDGNEITVLHKRYIQFKTFAQIAEEMNYSTRQTYRIHDNAVADVQRLLNDVIECQ